MTKLQSINMSASPLVLQQCEAIIEEELENMKKLIRALEVIKQMELYIDQYDDFESYCKNRWQKVITLDCRDKLTLNLITKDTK